MRSRLVAPVLSVLALAGCGAAPPPPSIAEPPSDDGGEAERILLAIAARDGAAMGELASAHGIAGCGTSGRAYPTCAGALLAVAAHARGLDDATRSLYEALSNGARWFEGPAAPRALARALESRGPAGRAAAALLVARAWAVFDRLTASADADQARTFAMGIGLPCPDVMVVLGEMPAGQRRAALAEAGCVPGGDDAATEAPETLAARGALEVLDEARQRLRGDGGAMESVVMAFEPVFNGLRLPITLPVSLAVQSTTITLPDVDAAPAWTPPAAILTIAGDSLHLGEPPWIGVGPRGPGRYGTVLPGPRTTLEALGDDLVQVLAASPPSSSGEASSGPVLLVADARAPADRIAAVVARLAALPDAPPAALAVRGPSGQSQIGLVGNREDVTAVDLQVTLAGRSATIVASGIALPSDRDLASLGRRLDEVRTTFPGEHVITVVPGADVTATRLIEVIRLAGSTAPRRFEIVRLSPPAP